MRRTVLVTGASSGIGLATAVELARRGFRAIGSVRSEEKAEALREAALEANVEVESVRLDVTDATACERVVTEVGPLYGLVNNAGYGGAGAIEDVSDAEARRMLETLPIAPARLARLALPGMRALGAGRIVNLSSIYGLIGAADVPPYHASKGAVRLMTKNDALIYAPDQIRVNSIHPGFIWTPMVEEHLRGTGATDMDAARKEVGLLHPLGHMGEPDDIAWGVVYLASDESKFVTGAELVIDGGYTAR